MVRERAKEIQRLEKLLEDAGIKLSSVASDISGVSGRLMLDALIAGQRDPGAALDSRVVARTRTALREARTRAHRLQDQAQVLTDLQPQAEDQPLLVPDDVENIDDVVTTVDAPVPSNRAERRAAQRQGKRPSTRTTQH